MRDDNKPLHSRGDWFGDVRLPEFMIRFGDCRMMVVGRYMQCQVHGAVQIINVKSREEELLCERLSRQWNASFRSGRLQEARYPKWPSKREIWFGRRDVGPHSIASYVVAPSLRFLTGRGIACDQLFLLHSDRELMRANNIVYSNIVAHVADVLGVDDYAASYLYLEHPILYRGPKAIEDCRELGVSPGLLAHLREKEEEYILPAARLLEKMGLDRHLRREGYSSLDYEQRSLSPPAKGGIALQPPELKDRPLTDIFAEAVPVASPYRNSRGEELKGCMARIHETGRVFCETKGHHRHGFLVWDQYPNEIQSVMSRALRDRIGSGTGGEEFFRKWMKSSKQWRYIDRFQEYSGIAPLDHLLSYVEKEVPPEIVAKWVPRNVISASEILWADFIHETIPELPIGYVAAAALTVGEYRDSWISSMKDHPEFLPRLLEALDAGQLYYINGSALREGRWEIASYESEEPVQDKPPSHLPSIERRLWGWAPERDVGVEDEQPTLPF